VGSGQGHLLLTAMPSVLAWLCLCLAARRAKGFSTNRASVRHRLLATLQNMPEHECHVGSSAELFCRCNRVLHRGFVAWRLPCWAGLCCKGVCMC